MRRIHPMIELRDEAIQTPKVFATNALPLNLALSVITSTAFAMMDITRSVVDEFHDELSLYYDDGTVALLANNTVFRVYRGVLTSKSPVFRDMILSHPTEQDTIYDGCPLVHLKDGPIELYWFLLALHDHVAFSACPKHSRFTAMTAIFRLGTKYDVVTLQKEALSFFSGYYAMALPNHRKRRLAPSVMDDFRALALARDLDLTFFLPAILYQCCIFASSSLIHLTSLLDEDEKNICLLGRETLQRQRTAVYSGIFRLGTAVGCTDTVTCTQFTLYGLATTIFVTEDARDYLSPSFLDEILPASRDPNRSGYCQRCYDRVTEFLEVTRFGCWKQLPAVFDLSSWEELETQRQDMEVRLSGS